MPFQRRLSKEDQEALDRMFACTKRQVQTAVQHWQLWALEAVLMAVVLEHETMAGEMVRRREEVSGSPTSPKW
jgi:hypothetical protein